MSRQSSWISGTNHPATLIVSFHDLAPPSREAAERFLEGLDRLGLGPATFLLVPRWHGGPPFTEDAGFTRWLGDLVRSGHELCLHGWTHRGETNRGGLFTRLTARHYTAGEGEFFLLDESEATRRIQAGRALFAAAGLPCDGFTAPAWLNGPGARAALEASGLAYYTTWSTLRLCPGGPSLPAPVLTPSSRAAWRRTVSKIWLPFWFALHRRTPRLRFAFHPVDFSYPEMEAFLWRLLRRAAHNRTCRTYLQAALQARPA